MVRRGDVGICGTKRYRGRPTSGRWRGGRRSVGRPRACARAPSPQSSRDQRACSTTPGRTVAVWLFFFSTLFVFSLAPLQPRLPPLDNVPVSFIPVSPAAAAPVPALARTVHKIRVQKIHTKRYTSISPR